MSVINGKVAAWSGALALLAYGASYASARSPEINAALAVVVLVAAAAAYRRSFVWGTAVVVLELVAGSLGRLFILPGPGAISVRMGLFALALLATVWYVARNRDWQGWLRNRIVRRPEPYAVLAALLLPLVNGLLRHPPSDVVGDANAYAYVLLYPTILLAFREERDRSRLYAVILGGVSAVGVLSLAALFLFTHGVSPTVASPLYRWIRDFGLGEVTPGPGGFARVFFQAHVWSMIGLLWSVSWLTLRRRAEERWLWIAGALSAAGVVLSLSRTLWLGSAVGLALIGAIVVGRSTLRRRFPLLVGVTAALLVAGALLPFLITRSVDDVALGRARLAGEAAADSRWNLLPVMGAAIREHPLLGSGFGRSLTYETRDPRLLAYFPSGQYTTTAFEWGWLDFWLKLGIFGTLVFLLWVVALVATGLRLTGRIDEPEAAIAAAVTASVLAVALAHVFSPWFNHPLGIGSLLIATAVLMRLERAMIKERSRAKNPASPGATP